MDVVNARRRTYHINIIDVMSKTDLTQFDIIPDEMKMYLSYYGPHFNKKLAKHAVSMMKKDNNESITPLSKEQVDTMLTDYGIKIKNKILYDAMYLANMIKADFYGGSIKTEQDMCLHVKEILDDPDGYEGIAFNRWLADMARKGEIIDWEEMI